MHDLEGQERITRALGSLRKVSFGLIFLVCWANVPFAIAAPVLIENPGFEALYFGSNLPAQYNGDVPTGSFPTGAAPASWTAYYENGGPAGGEFLGILNPGTNADYAAAGAGMSCFPGGAPEGDNFALLYTSGDAGGPEYGLSQTLSATLEAETVYTLSAEIGNIQSCAGLVAPYQNFFNIDGFPGYRLQLFAGDTLLAEDPGLLTPGEGLVERATVQFTTGANPVGLDEPLRIRLINSNLPDVPGVSGIEVDFDDIQLDASPAAPVPLSPWIALSGLLGGLLMLGVGNLKRAL